MDDLAIERPPWRRPAIVVSGVAVLVVVAAATAIAVMRPAKMALLPSPTSTPTSTAENSTTPYFTSADVPHSSRLYADRVADQVDVRSFESQVKKLRFPLRSEVMRPGAFAITDQHDLIRQSWAVPMGETDIDGQSYLAVVTTRCVVDYHYPASSLHAKFSDLALILGAEEEKAIFRVSDPATLDGTVFDPQTQRILFTQRPRYLAGPFGDRYFNDLVTGNVHGVIARLPIGQWSSNDGVDLVVLYFPLSDPEVRLLRPKQHLGVGQPEEILRGALADRTSLWGDTFQFALVSEECMAALERDTAEVVASRDSWKHLTMFAVAAAAAMFAPALASLGQSGLPAFMQALGKRATTQLGEAVWHTATRVLHGEDVHKVAWDEAGRLVISFVSANGALEHAIIAGLKHSRLSKAQSGRIAATVRGLLSSGDPVTVSVLRKTHGDHRFASLLLPYKRIDVAAELLRRVLVPLDVADTDILAQQPTLVRAAVEALDAEGDHPAIADHGYRDRLRQLAMQWLNQQ